MVAERSISVLSNMLDDVKKIWFVALITAQSVFMLLYAYSIYANVNRLFFLIAYITLFALSILSFILFLIKNKNKKFNKTFFRTKNFFKYAVNATMIIVSIIETIKYGISDFNKILLIVSGVSLLAQIFIEGIKIFTEKYTEDFKTAVSEDFGWVNYLNPERAKSNLIKLIDAPFEKLANLKQGKEKEISKEAQRVEEHVKRFKAKREERNSIKKTQEKSRIKSELDELKSHVATIFKKTKPETENEAETDNRRNK